MFLSFLRYCVLNSSLRCVSLHQPWAPWRGFHIPTSSWSHSDPMGQPINVRRFEVTSADFPPEHSPPEIVAKQIFHFKIFHLRIKEKAIGCPNWKHTSCKKINSKCLWWHASNQVPCFIIVSHAFFVQHPILKSNEVSWHVPSPDYTATRPHMPHPLPSLHAAALVGESLVLMASLLEKRCKCSQLLHSISIGWTIWFIGSS